MKLAAHRTTLDRDSSPPGSATGLETVDHSDRLPVVPHRLTDAILVGATIGSHADRSRSRRCSG